MAIDKLMKQYNYLPDFWGAIFILAAVFILDILFDALLSSLGLEFQSFIARSGILVVLAHGLVFSIFMHLSAMPYADLFHASPNSIMGTITVLVLPIMLICLAALWWVIDLAYFIASFFPADEISLQVLEQSMQPGWDAFITICVIAPLIEEMLFRGIILRGFLACYSSHTAILLSAILFALAHLNIYQIPVAFILGVFSAWLFVRTQSLWPSIIAHAIYNSGAFWMTVNSVPLNNSKLATVFSLGISVAGVYCLYLIFRQTKRF